MREPLTIEYVRALRVVRNVENYLENAGDSELVFSHILTMLQQDGFAQRAEKPAPVRDAAESAIEGAINAAYTCSAYTREDRDAARAELSALRARFAGLEGTLQAHITVASGYRQEIRDARALLAVERELLLKYGEHPGPCAYFDEGSSRDDCDCGFTAIEDRLRALAQPRAERETT